MQKSKIIVFICLTVLLSQTVSAFNVTFRVDMNNHSGYTTPELNGTFNNWCGNCAAMSNVDGTSIWQITIDLPAGTYEYKFSHDNWTGQEILSPGSTCTITTGNFTNRIIAINQDTELPIVCFG